MKSALILGLVGTALGAAIPDDVPTRTLVLPGFPNGGNPFPTRDANEKRGDIELGGPTPDPDKVQIVGVTYGGTGCPSNTVSHVLSDDRQVMTLIFDEYVASIGPEVPITQNRKNCQLNINLRYPGGFQFSIFSADYRGYANLEKGITGTQKSTYYFSGQTQQTNTQTQWKGPFSGDFLLHDEAENTSTVWSPCGANGALNINSQIRLTSSDRNAQGIMTNDSLDASFKQIVHFRWRECTE
ncbi:hypothetical protein D8B26_007256 [Coccidioides posadasii str. Silveira]|nr:hypothetical protein CPC735_013000 [Coccidioides posadasii C735 delta SOWgp]EFW19076.1 conserved hypothetical protein [Coccidioides posadasii str. Silveira]KMM71421.1 secreted protein [Coccidioides posadasii RMSCC 3488]KMP09562.1 secreted protein [Coccidioides immitis RMSCC 2394]KMU76928.1 hypothetical protein CISG_05970 [Coccidioides immitis RMSCC 3703]KMU90876.1 secreted protein [Coccidioides immitis H538.4]TPX20355.1 hypothetical protein DIZ76_016243 [Coccidioides immitis]|eukprot:XP_003072127.1 hypothetical protein CPC735_013000 [Coccidioides posadasii C735 delta SOWgp]